MLLIILLLFRICFSLKVYHSQLPIESKSGLSGLKYLKEQQNSNIFSNSFTICSRFNFKKLGNTARLFEIQPSNNSEANFLWLSISYPWTWFGFGNSDKKLNGSLQAPNKSISGRCKILIPSQNHMMPEN